jgi:hypothetical protein
MSHRQATTKQKKVSNSAKHKKGNLVSLLEFIEPLYGNQKLNKSYREKFEKKIAKADVILKKLTPKNEEYLLNLSQKKDACHIITLELILYILEFEKKKDRPDICNYLLSFVEYLINHISSFKGSKKTLNVQLILSEGVNKGWDEIDKIKDVTGTQLNETTRKNLKYIVVILLYLEGKIEFEYLTEKIRWLSFNLKGESISNNKAISFIVKMANSTNKSYFGHYFNYQKKNEQISRSNINHLKNKIDNQKSEIQQLKDLLAKSNAEKQQLNETIAGLHQQLEQTKIEARHQVIHQRDENKNLRGKLIYLLEDNLLINLESAKVANSRTPAKIHVVGIKLENIIEEIRRQITWLRK